MQCECVFSTLFAVLPPYLDNNQKYLRFFAAFYIILAQLAITNA